MYGEKLSVAGFFGSIPDIVSDDGDHQYTIDKKKAYAEYPDTRAVALQDRFGGWIRDDVTMVNDTNADQVTASDLAIREARNRVDGVKDVVPIYVRRIPRTPTPCKTTTPPSPTTRTTRSRSGSRRVASTRNGTPT